MIGIPFGHNLIDNFAIYLTDMRKLILLLLLITFLFSCEKLVTDPNAPVATAATGIDQTNFTANWKALNYTAYYQIDVAYNISFTSFLWEDNYAGVGTSTNFAGLTPGETYYYRLRAVGLSQTSGNSNTITVTTIR